MRSTLAFFFAASLGVVLGASCGSSGAACDASTCAGCCDAQGQCQGGTEAAACGQGGASCAACGADQACGAGVCAAADAGTGGGTGGGSVGGGTGGGSVGGGTGGGSVGGGTGGGSVGGGTGGGAPDGGAACLHLPGPADAVRKVVVSHPYLPDAGPDDSYEVFDLSPAGALTSTGQTFHMGRALSPNGLITFTPDGTVGLSPQEDGSLGVFRFEADGGVTVVQAAYQGDFYATQVLMDPSGAYAWVVDMNTRNNGGGLYKVAIACDGTVTSLGRQVEGDTATAMAWLNGTPDTAVVASRTLVGAPAPSDTHLLTLGASPTIDASAAGFPDTDAIPPQVAVSPDDRWVAVPDNGFLAGNRVAMLELDAGALVPRQLLTTSNPMAVVFSPFARGGVVVNSDGADQVRLLTFDPMAPSAPWTVAASPLTYTYGRPQLPGVPALLTRGALNGRMLIAELDAVRQLQFLADGGVQDVSKTAASGSGMAQIVGTLGVAP